MQLTQLCLNSLMLWKLEVPQKSNNPKLSSGAGTSTAPSSAEAPHDRERGQGKLDGQDLLARRRALLASLQTHDPSAGVQSVDHQNVLNGSAFKRSCCLSLISRQSLPGLTRPAFKARFQNRKGQPAAPRRRRANLSERAK